MQILLLHFASKNLGCRTFKDPVATDLLSY
jgi:hypothetical protein